MLDVIIQLKMFIDVIQVYTFWKALKTRVGSAQTISVPSEQKIRHDDYLLLNSFA